MNHAPCAHKRTLLSIYIHVSCAKVPRYRTEVPSKSIRCMFLRTLGSAQSVKETGTPAVGESVGMISCKPAGKSSFSDT
jgi:hypothetical protein